ncbi:hypothetical protein PPYR_12115 [Photinus pyralis]|uniref:G-protein coupled receptors family 1 profile domain-containing protein n=1 Tax=Photinus pyralis TaxID=7054 RepID=A0A1Y1KED7_PHOPY|nr:C-C chemokine receptor type 3-like [Photinus pyralis]KAB0795276.1 hypothetical protein PPYR_12115 [Photinus pyralis]
MDYGYEANLTTDDNGEISYSATNAQIAQEVILTIAFMIGVAADICIFFTIFCYKRVRTIPNIFLANWAIADMLCLMVAPSSYRVLSFITHNSLDHNFACVISDIGSTLHFTTNVFVIVTLADWFIGAYFGRASERFHAYYVHVIGTIWTISIVVIGVSTSICFHYFSLLIHHVLITSITYALVLILVIIFQLSRLIQKLRKSPFTSSPLILNLATAYIFCTIFSILMLFVHLLARIESVEVLFFILLFCSSVVNLALICTFNNDFRSCLMQAVRCTGNQDDGTFDFNNPIRNNQNGSNISRRRLSEELLTDIS